MIGKGETCSFTGGRAEPNMQGNFFNGPYKLVGHFCTLFTVTSAWCKEPGANAYLAVGCCQFASLNLVQNMIKILHAVHTVDNFAPREKKFH